MKKTLTPKQIKDRAEAARIRRCKEFSAIGNAARWKGKTAEERKAATAKATEARRKNAEIRRLEAAKTDG